MEPVSEKAFEEADKKPTKSMEDIKVESDSGEVIVGLEKFIKFATVQKVIAIGGMTIVMKTLKSSERDAATDSVKTSPEETVMTYLKKVRIPLLSQAIVKVDQVSFTTQEHKKLLVDYLKNAQDALVDHLWAEYEKMSNEQYELFSNEDLKKK